MSASSQPTTILAELPGVGLLATSEKEDLYYVIEESGRTERIPVERAVVLWAEHCKADRSGVAGSRMPPAGGRSAPRPTTKVDREGRVDAAAVGVAPQGPEEDRSATGAPAESAPARRRQRRLDLVRRDRRELDLGGLDSCQDDDTVGE